MSDVSDQQVFDAISFEFQSLSVHERLEVVAMRWVQEPEDVGFDILDRLLSEPPRPKPEFERAAHVECLKELTRGLPVPMQTELTKLALQPSA